jgi:hypothetical protein
MCLFLMSIVRGGAPAFLANIGLGLKGLQGAFYFYFFIFYFLSSATKKKKF